MLGGTWRGVNKAKISRDANSGRNRLPARFPVVSNALIRFPWKPGKML